MSPEMIIGLRISVIGLGVTFVALGLLGIVMRYLPSLFPVKQIQAEGPSPIVEKENDQLEEMSVALAVGICLLEERHALDYQDPSLGNLLEPK